MNKTTPAPVAEAVAETVAETPAGSAFESATLPAAHVGRKTTANPFAAVVAELAALYTADPAAYAKMEGNARVHRISETDTAKRKTMLTQAVRQLRAAGTTAGVTTRVFPEDDGKTATIVFGVTASRKHAEKPAETAPAVDVPATDDAPAA